MRRRAALPVLLGVFLGVACKKPDAQSAAVAPEARARVDTVVVEERNAPKVLTLTGTLDAQERTDLAANATGRVLRTFVERGEHVAAGAVIAQLDTRSASLSRAEAEANAKTANEQVTSARLDCDRNEDLLKKGAISKAEYDRTNATCRIQAASEEAAKVRAASASQTIGDASIRAPFSGIVSERFAHVGDYVRPDTKVVTLLVDDPLRLRLSVPETSISYAKQGVVVAFETVATPERSFSGTIRFIGREVRANTRDLVVEALVDNRDGALLPGMFVTAHLPIGQGMLPVIPRRALVPLEGNQTVFVVVDGRLQQRVVQPGAVVGDDIVVLDGLRKAERLVVEPAKAADGQLVE